MKRTCVDACRSVVKNTVSKIHDNYSNVPTLICPVVVNVGYFIKASTVPLKLKPQHAQPSLHKQAQPAAAHRCESAATCWNNNLSLISLPAYIHSEARLDPFPACTEGTPFTDHLFITELTRLYRLSFIFTPLVN